MRRQLLLLGMGAGLASPADSASVSVAVAANFTATAEKLTEVFEASSGHEAKLSFGATGALYAQIVHGAPYEILLAADQMVPQRTIGAAKVVLDQWH